MEELVKFYDGSCVRLEYLITGGENSETLVFLHGAGSNLRQFLNQHEYFSKKYRVVSLSLRGHGRSGLPQDNGIDAYSVDKHVKDIIELLEHLEVEKFHIIGNSIGGMLGYSLIDTIPERVLTITTYGTAPELKYSQTAVNIFAGIDRGMINISRKLYMKILSLAVSKNKSTQKEIYRLFMQGDKDTVWKFRYNIGNYSYVRVIENMDIPSLIINGEWDGGITRCVNSVLDTIQKNKKLSIVSLQNAGHVANLDRPLEFNKIIYRHVRGSLTL